MGFSCHFSSMEERCDDSADDGNKQESNNSSNG